MGINAGHIAAFSCSTRTSAQSMRGRSCIFVSALLISLFVSLPISASSFSSDNIIIAKTETSEKNSQLMGSHVNPSFIPDSNAVSFPTQHMRVDTLKVSAARPDSVLVDGAFIFFVADACTSVRSKHDIFALRTNLLYDAATMVNAELEIALGRRMSIIWEDTFPWWEYGNKYCLQYWAMGPEARIYFRRWDSDTKFRGMYAGVYGLSGKYDFQYDTKLCYQGEFWSSGLSFGYAKAIGKKQRVNMDFSISFGYLTSNYRHYKPAFDYSELIKDNYNTGAVSYMGPTKVKIVLSVPVHYTRKAKEVSYE